MFQPHLQAERHDVSTLFFSKKCMHPFLSRAKCFLPNLSLSVKVQQGGSLSTISTFDTFVLCKDLKRYNGRCPVSCSFRASFSRR